jgi:hypothetical protein
MTDLPVAVTVTNAEGQSVSAAGTITVTAAPTTINVGETTILTEADNGNGNLLVAQPITLAQPASLQSLSFYVATVGGQLRLGLYSGATPTALVAQTAAFTPVAGWNTQPVTSAQLPAGQYWLAYFPQSNTLAFRKAETGGTSYFKTVTFAAMPSTFPASPSTTSSHWSLYGTFALPAPDTTPPSVPTNVTAVEVPGVQITVSWTASTDNVGVTGYNILRNGTEIGTSTTTTYADTGPLTTGVGYTYNVSAFDAAGNTSMPSSFGAIVFPTRNISPPAIVPIGEGLSNVNVGNPPNANFVVGAISVTTADGRPYPGQVILGGADASKFVISNGGLLPCNLVVGSSDIAAGSYNITLTAN